MTDAERVQQFVQDVYLTRYNRFIDDITDTDGQAEIEKTIRWTNTFIQEFEREADWQFLRTNDNEIGTIATSTQIFDMPATVRKLVIDAERPLVLMFDGSIISKFEVVDPNQLTRRTTTPGADRVSVVNNKLAFSRPFSDYEIGSDVIADTIARLPELETDNADLLDVMADYYEILVLGVAKNATLPDIVQGGLSPSFVQKYGDELGKAVAENNASSTADTVVTDDYSSIGGNY